MKTRRISILIGAVVIPLLVGAVSATLSRQGMLDYGSMIKPPLSPPAWVFSVVWTILYIMMGLASYRILVAEADTSARIKAMIPYAIQLAMNFVWSLIFFNGGQYLLAFLWLLIMCFFVVLCAIWFYRIDRLAGYLLIPYVVWSTFAAYLNAGTCLLATGYMF